MCRYGLVIEEGRTVMFHVVFTVTTTHGHKDSERTIVLSVNTIDEVYQSLRDAIRDCGRISNVTIIDGHLVELPPDIKSLLSSKTNDKMTELERAIAADKRFDEVLIREFDKKGSNKC